MLDRLRKLRDRWFADPAFRQRIERLPLGKRIADRHAKRLFGIVSGFAQSQMLSAGIDAGLFAVLRDGPLSRADLAARLDLPPAGFAALVQALEAMGLVGARGERVALTIDGLVVATDAGIRAMVAHNRLLYRDLAEPLAMLRAPGSGSLSAFWPYAGGSGDPKGYSELMAASQGFVAAAVLTAVDFARFASVVDVGGGDGSFLAAVAATTAYPRLTLVDLAPVVAIARARLAERGLGDRIEAIATGAGQALPSADAITLVRVLHDRDDAAALALLREVAGALNPGGRVIVAEPVARSAPDPQSVYFAAYFAAMGAGRLRTAAELDALLAEAGLVRRATSSSLLVDVITTEHITA